MKRFVKHFCGFLVLVMVLAIPAYATEAAEPRASSFFIGSSVYLYELSGNTFAACFDVTGTGIMEKIGASYIKIQRSSDGVNWTTMKTYSMEDYSYLTCANTATHASNVTYTGTSGYYYRAHIQLYAKNSSGFGTMNRYTSALYIPTN